MKLQRWHLAVMVLATAGLVIMAPSDEVDPGKKGARPVKAATQTTSAERPASGVGARVELELLTKTDKQHKEMGRVSDIFNQTSWYVAPPPSSKVVESEAPVVALPPPVPVAPPLPFTYLGRYGDTDSRTVVLSKGDKVYTVTVGEIIENTYRVNKYTKGAVNLTYLPLNIVQSLRTGEPL